MKLGSEFGQATPLDELQRGSMDLGEMEPAVEIWGLRMKSTSLFPLNMIFRLNSHALTIRVVLTGT